MPSNSRTCDENTQFKNVSIRAKKGKAVASDKRGSLSAFNTCPATNSVFENNVASSFTATTDVNNNCILGSSDAGTSAQRVNPVDDDAETQHTKEDYDKLMTLCQKMFGRLQSTAAFLRRLSTNLQGQADPVSMALSDEIGNLKLDSILSDADETLAVAEQVDRPSSVGVADASVPPSLTVSGNLSLEAFVVAEAAVIKTKVAELQDQLEDVADQLADAQSELSAKDLMIEHLKQQLASRVDVSAGKSDPSGGGDRSSTSSVANPDTVACECSEFDDYVKGLVKVGLDLVDDKTEVKPPKRVDPSIHESITTVVTVAKKVQFHRVQRVFLKLRESNHDIARDVTEVLERVVSAKFMTNDVVQGLKNISPDPKTIANLLPDLIQVSRDVRDALIFAESQLKSVQEVVTVNKHIHEVTREVDDITQVLRDVKNRRTAVSRRHSNDNAMKYRKQSF